MRTKTLLLTAALSAAGIATSMAQVYSVNAVGYINLTVQPGFNLLANQLIQTNTTLAALLPNPPDQTVFYRFTSGVGYQISTYDLSGAGGWDPTDQLTFDLGSGAFILNPTASAFQITLVGEVPQGTLLNPVPAGFSIKSSKVPQAGLIQTVLQYPPADQDAVYKFVNDGPGGQPDGYQINVYDLSGAGDWDPQQPNLEVGTAVFINSAAGHAWTRTFTVN